MTPEEQKLLEQRQKNKNIAVALSLLAFIVAVFLITFMKMYLA